MKKRGKSKKVRKVKNLITKIRYNRLLGILGEKCNLRNLYLVRYSGSDFTLPRFYKRQKFSVIRQSDLDR